MFVDRVRLRVIGGGGGNGCCSFRREKFVPRGGPDSRLVSLLDLRGHSIWKGKRGVHGRGSGCHGKNGENVAIHIPPGTLIRDTETDEVVGDLTVDGQTFLAARGGRGGKGNARFASSTNRAPRFAELGEPGQEAEYTLELKLIADVGLVGLPNAGKSTFLSVVTAATPKIADYPFTTLSPNLGVAQLSGYRTMTIADIPGIIEGAAEGKGLGHDFLRHIERTRVLLFLVDLGNDDPVAVRETLEAELVSHSPAFAQRPRVFALTKADIPENRARFDEVASKFDSPAMISSVTREGLDLVMERLWQLVDRARGEEAGAIIQEPETEYTFEAPYTIKRTNAGFRIEGKAVTRALKMTDFENEEAVRHFQRRLQHMGVFKALKRMGARDGQPIFIEEMELEYQSD